MNQSSFLNPWFWLMPNRSYVHASWTSIGNLGWIALPPRSSLMKCEASYLRQGWVERSSFLPWPELRILHSAHRVTHPLSLWGYEHSWVSLSGDHATLSMSVKFLHEDHAHPWHLRGLLCQVAVSLTIIWGLMPFWMVVFVFSYHNIYARLVVVFVH